MKITLSPTGEPYGHPFSDALSLEKQGEVLIINGQRLDFSVIPAGATLPDGAEKTGCPYVVGDIERNEEGQLQITLLLPHAANAPRDARFPVPIVNPVDGVVPLPETNWPILVPEQSDGEHHGN
ncbi:hypothetical protein [Paenalcaligenes suwonensis]|uniref:hypothetical protein n=1 Tax=Paenalcaligenes suwonensis TaxID=1202713 RepID=UPI00140B5061|nr:hypothetical protein [Paenalcaligenes suwonensis]NHC62588.1 hypothetical protein [Paenalcaligenes suwonensis]